MSSTKNTFADQSQDAVTSPASIDAHDVFDADGPFNWNDAICLDNVSDDILNKPVTVAFGAKSSAEHFANTSGHLAQLFDAKLSKFRIGPKDGPCMLQGALASNRRSSKNVTKNYLVLLDVDNGTTLDEIEDLIRERVLFAVLWTTHSHGKAVTEVPESALNQFCTKHDKALGNDDEEILAAACEYLSCEKQYRPELLVNATYGGQRMVPDKGMCFVLKHAPMDRVRVLLVLSEAFDFMTGGSQAQRITTWKNAYTALAGDLGIAVDTACVDPARLMYLPSKASKDVAGRIIVIPGHALDLKEFEAGACQQDVRGTFKNAAANSDSPIDGNNRNYVPVTPGLKKFVVAYPDFEVVEWLRDIAPDDERQGGPSTGGIHWTCPRELDHTDPSPTDTAFAVFQNESRGWGMNCMHTGCQSAFGGDRLQYLDALCYKYRVGVDTMRAFSETARAEDADGGAFRLTDKGKVAANEPENIRLAVMKMSIKLTFNELSNRARVEGLWDRGTDLDDAAMNRFRLRMKDEFDFLPSKELFGDVISDLARQNAFHPVKDYLDEIQPKWDGKPRINRLLIDYLGAEDTPFNREVGAIFMVAAVRRMRRPGCKYDELLVLISGQGTGKSSGIAALTGEQEWFTDNLPMNASPKETIEQTRGKWIGEIAELQGNHREVETIKAFLSRQVDTARGAYGRLSEDVKRSFVCIGTTNSEQFLKDRTGNRRFWPVKVGEIDLVAIKRDRDQLWAEAAHLEASDARDEAIRLDRSLWSAATEAQNERLVVNPYREALEAALGDRVGRIKAEDVYRLLGISVERRHQTMMELIGEAMRELGWEKHKVRFDRVPLTGYLKGTDAQRSLVLSLVKEDTTGRLCLSPEDAAQRMIAEARARCAAAATTD